MTVSQGDTKGRFVINEKEQRKSVYELYLQMTLLSMVCIPTIDRSYKSSRGACVTTLRNTHCTGARHALELGTLGISPLRKLEARS